MQYIIAIALAIFLYYIQDSYYKRHWNDQLTVTITYNQTYAHIGDTLELTEIIRNQKQLPLSLLYVKFRTSRSFIFEQSSSAAISDYYYRNDAFSILGNQQITRKLPFQVAKRGYYTINSVHLVAKDLFLIKTYATVTENDTSLYVYPGLLLNHQDIQLTNTIIGDILTRNLYEDPMSFRGIRDYCSGDSMRYINWKATAKNSSLQVNTFYDTQQAHVMLLVNLDTQKPGHTERLKEYILSVAATLIQQLNNHGVYISLQINSNDCLTGTPLCITDGSGTEHLHKLFQGIARMDVNSPATDFYQLLHSASEPDGCDQTSYLILSNDHNTDLIRACATLQQQGKNLIFLCPEYASFLHTANVTLDHFYYWEITNDNA